MSMHEGTGSRVCRCAIPILLLAALVLAADLPHADTVTLTPVKDNTLYEPIQQDAYADMSDGVGPTLFTGKVKDAKNQAGQVAVRRGVVEFDIAANVPAGATITSVQLTMYCDKVGQNTNFNVSLHRALSEWGEGTSNTGNSQQGRGEPATTNDATWRHTFYSAQFWPVAGGSYASTASATRTVGAVGSYTWGSTSGMVADVQAWLTASQNHGWVIIGTETQIQTTKRFGTRENATSSNRPRLVVDYTPLTVTGACCNGSTCTVVPAGTCAPPAIYQGNGTTCSPNPCVVLTGACCASNGTCTQVTASSCQTSGGSYVGDNTTCASTMCPVQLTPYMDALPVPPKATPVSGTQGGTATYNLTVKESRVRLHSQLPLTTVWGFDDGTSGAGILGPTIEAHTDQPVTVRWINDLRDATTGLLRTSHYLPVDTSCINGAVSNAKTVFHLHGGHIPAAVDGYPEDAFLPGSAPVTYVYPNDQQAGFLWYHDHAMGVTRLNVIMGLAGLYFVRDAVEGALNLPTGTNEVPLVIQDRTFNPDGSFYYPSMWEDHFFGDKVLVNGKVWPYLDVKKGKYRFRIVNGSTSRVYTLALSPPSGTMTFTVIGTELGLLAAPVYGVGQLTIAPGERYDVVLDFAGRSTGEDIFLENSAGAPFPNGVVDLTDVMKFHVLGTPGDTDPLPSTLRPVTHLNPAQSVITRDLVLKRSGNDGCGRQNWLINGLGFMDVTEYPRLGTVEIWRYINDSGVSHPMHMHLVGLQVLDRQPFVKGANGEIIPTGSPVPPAAEENGWKDTALVAPNEILRVIVPFEDYKGRFPYHCHILEHEDHEMMRQFETVLCGDAVMDPTEECDDGGLAGGVDGCSATCEVEEKMSLSGTAVGGGQVRLTISGVLVSVNTVAGQTSAQVIAALAAAINANSTLAGLGVTASASQDTLTTNGDITQVTVTDTGLTDVFRLTAHPDRLWWTTVAGATGYDLVRGGLGSLRASGGNFTTSTQTCLADNRVQTFWNHTETPVPGDGMWYLVRKVTGGGPGSYDDGTQVGSRDAEIAASASHCP